MRYLIITLLLLKFHNTWQASGIDHSLPNPMSKEDEEDEDDKEVCANEKSNQQLNFKD